MGMDDLKIQRVVHTTPNIESVQILLIERKNLVVSLYYNFKNN